MPPTPDAHGTPHRLVVMRHARAESFAPDDAQRHLTDRGRAEASARGRWLSEAVGPPELAMVSSAVRTRETWELVAEALGADSEVRLEDALYGASPDAVLDLLRALPESVGSVLYLGHNPTAADLAVELGDGSAAPTVLARLAGGLPTAGVAVFRLAGTWAELGPGSCTLTAYDG